MIVTLTMQQMILMELLWQKELESRALEYEEYLYEDIILDNMFDALGW